MKGRSLLAGVLELKRWKDGGNDGKRRNVKWGRGQFS